MSQARAQQRGFAGDRRYMVVDERGRFLTQREERLMALIQTSLRDDGFELSASGVTPLCLPWAADGPRRQVTVWRSEVEAAEVGVGSAWFSQVLGRAAHLVYLPEEVARPVDPSYAPGQTVSFADGFAYLLTTESSLSELNRRLLTPLEMERFRPNIVISGSEPFAEDDWTTVELGPVRVRNVKPCERCVVTTIDPETAEKSPEPLRTLATFRRVDGAVHFGINGVLEGDEGTLNVGEPVAAKSA